MPPPAGVGFGSISSSISCSESSRNSSKNTAIRMLYYGPFTKRPVYRPYHHKFHEDLKPLLRCLFPNRQQVSDLSEKHEKEGEGNPRKHCRDRSDGHIHLFSLIAEAKDGEEGHLLIGDVGLLGQERVGEHR